MSIQESNCGAAMFLLQRQPMISCALILLRALISVTYFGKNLFVETASRAVGNPSIPIRVLLFPFPTMNTILDFHLLLHSSSPSWLKMKGKKFHVIPAHVKGTRKNLHAFCELTFFLLSQSSSINLLRIFLESRS